MKKSILYIFFLIILPISYGGSENTGCNRVNNPDNKEQSDNNSQSENSSNNEPSAYSKD